MSIALLRRHTYGLLHSHPTAASPLDALAVDACCALCCDACARLVPFLVEDVFKVEGVDVAGDIAARVLTRVQYILCLDWWSDGLGNGKTWGVREEEV
jgi:hypothetical protein